MKILHLHRCSVGEIRAFFNRQTPIQGVIETDGLSLVGELACGAETIKKFNEGEFKPAR